MKRRSTRPVPVAPSAVEIGGAIGSEPSSTPITNERPIRRPRHASRVTQWISRSAILDIRRTALA